MSWQDEQDLMNADCQSTFGKPVSFTRQTKGGVDPDTGAETIIGTATRTVSAIYGEPEVQAFTGSSGRTQRIVRMTFEIEVADLDEDLLGPGAGPFGPIREGDIITTPDLTVAMNGSGDGAGIDYTVKHAPLSADGRFYKVTAFRSEVTS